MTEWEPPKDVNPWMVSGANKIGDFVIPGPRHFDDTMHEIISRLNLESAAADMEQGFIDQWGRFYSREDAMKMVKASGQPFNLERNGSQDTELFSEGLY